MSIMEHILAANPGDSASSDAPASAALTLADPATADLSLSGSAAPEVVTPGEDADAPKSEGEEKEGEEKEGEDTDALGADGKPDPLHKNPRFKKVIDERNTFKTRAQELESRTAELEEKAKRADAYADILDDLDKEGWKDGKTAREALIERNRQQAEFQTAAQEDEQYRASVEQTILRQIDAGELTREYGELVYQNALQERQIARYHQQVQSQQQHFQQQSEASQKQQQQASLEREIEGLKKSLNDPDLDAELVRDLHLSTGGSLKDIATRISTRDRAIRENARLAAATSLGKNNDAPRPSGGGSAPITESPPAKLGRGFSQFWGPSNKPI